jgi:uncharacterized RDD family membrane protein YckC
LLAFEKKQSETFGLRRADTPLRRRAGTLLPGSALTWVDLSASIAWQSMTWYYGIDGRRQGPVQEAELETLQLVGAIEWTTPVWREGMTAWKPFGEIFRRASVQCHECNRKVDKEPVVHYRDLFICPRCKSSFFQKLREGLASEEVAEYCGFWIRFCARLLDGLILLAASFPLSTINQVIIFRFYPITGPGIRMERFASTAQLGPFLAVQAGFVLVSLMLAFAYEVYFVGRFGGTPGKLLLRMRIVRSDFSRLTYGRAAIRFFGKMLSDLTMYIGYLMVAFDPQCRALHDHIADTRVIKRDQPGVLVPD